MRKKLQPPPACFHEPRRSTLPHAVFTAEAPSFAQSVITDFLAILWAGSALVPVFDDTRSEEGASSRRDLLQGVLKRMRGTEHAALGQDKRSQLFLGELLAATAKACIRISSAGPPHRCRSAGGDAPRPGGCGVE